MPLYNTDDIKVRFDRVIQYSQNLDGVQLNTKEIFKNWHYNKTPFINAFGNKLIYSLGYHEFDIDDKTLKEMIETKIIIPFQDYTDFASQYKEFYNFLWNNVSAFHSNILEKDYVISKDKTIKAGTKFTKSFKHFITDEDDLNKAQSLASEVIQCNKISGELCLSVHPLDYLSVSETTYKWRSCHALDGEYRAGNLSYVQDGCTIVCYLKNESGDDYRLPHFPDDVRWNSKKWRMLLFVSEDKKMIFAGRQYPFDCPGILEPIREKYLELFTKRDAWWGDERECWINWQNTYIGDIEFDNGDYMEYGYHYIPVPGAIARMADIIKDQGAPTLDMDDGDYPLHYNDLLRSTCYTKPYYSFYKYSSGELPQFKIGHATKCVVCGEEYIVDEYMVCPCCQNNIHKEKEEYDTSNDTIETPWEPVERETLLYGTPHIANVSYVTEAINPFLEVDS